jgi:hypothetical protein
MGKNKMKIISIIVLLSYNIIAQDIDVCFGNYNDVEVNNRISFIFDNSGIHNLMILGNFIPDSLVKYDLLGIYGESLLMKINFEEGEIGNSIYLLIFNDSSSGKSNLIISSGYYVEILWLDAYSNKKRIKNKFAFELEKEEIHIDYYDD